MPMGAVVEEVRRLVGNGCAEVVLTGVDITAGAPTFPGARASAHWCARS